MQMCLYEAVGELLWSPGGPQCHHGRLCEREAETGHTGQAMSRWSRDSEELAWTVGVKRPRAKDCWQPPDPGEKDQILTEPLGEPWCHTLYGVRRLQGRADSLLFHPVPLQSVTCQNAFLHWAARCLLQAPPQPCSSLLVPSQAAGWPLQLRPWLAAVTETRVGRDVGGGEGTEGGREEGAGRGGQ